MSLLAVNIDPRLNQLAQSIYDVQLSRDPRLMLEYDDRRRKLMFQDILYNLSFLQTAVQLEDSRIFVQYARWIVQLLCNLMQDLDRDRIRKQMVHHYHIMIEQLPRFIGEPELNRSVDYLKLAIEVTEQADTDINPAAEVLGNSYSEIRQAYLGALLRSDTRMASQIIDQAAVAGTPIPDIYESILQRVMFDVGELWYRNQITVDKEHYCTSTTQMVLSKFYPQIFSQPRKNLSMIACCVGSELHEMGGRMVSDLFENHGWDSVYLGAAVPLAALLHAVTEHRPNLVALSVTMPQHLLICRDTVDALRQHDPDLKIAVGGRAFQSTSQIWTKWPIDFYSDRASELISWADPTFGPDHPSPFGAVS